ncbi:hypothetical protein B0J11DRAFT_618871 [Dendryphion nanum]|uniref:Uncharacterized protein n=1 Tax=Dendryphion nanum TaxID=256645 RepID=A0A9P9DAA8_9PLEO|nr:hypothetical protein B0J11DRAFT_618871 [Dendryphion nanum]
MPALPLAIREANIPELIILIARKTSSGRGGRQRIKTKLKGGALAGIVTSCVAAGFVLFFIVFVYYHKKDQKRDRIKELKSQGNFHGNQARY